MERKTTKKDVENFIKSFLSGKSIFKIRKETNFNYDTIKKWLLKEGIEIKKGNFNKQKTGFTEEEKKTIIDLYVNQKRGAKYIGSIFKRSDSNITYWLKKWNISKNTKSEISTKIRQVYGATKGFSGFTHKKESKKKISKSGKKAWSLETRIAKTSKSRTYNTIYGKVIGKYEVAYLQSLIDNECKIPLVNLKKIKTPFGYYTPDFEFNDKFIEIKSEFTMKILKGLYKNESGNRSKQLKKINWISKNIKKVDIIVLKQSEVRILFNKAVKNKLIL